MWSHVSSIASSLTSTTLTLTLTLTLTHPFSDPSEPSHPSNPNLATCNCYRCYSLACTSYSYPNAFITLQTPLRQSPRSNLARNDTGSKLSSTNAHTRWNQLQEASTKLQFSRALPQSLYLREHTSSAEKHSACSKPKPQNKKKNTAQFFFFLKEKKKKIFGFEGTAAGKKNWNERASAVGNDRWNVAAGE